MERVEVSGCVECPFADWEDLNAGFCAHPRYWGSQASPGHPDPGQFEASPRPEWCPLGAKPVMVVPAEGLTHCPYCGNKYGDGKEGTVVESSVGEGCVRCYVHR